MPIAPPPLVPAWGFTVPGRLRLVDQLLLERGMKCGIAGCCRGHGTLLVDGELISAVCGVVQRVNKLVSVAPLAGRYNAQLGDVVVGRVAEIVAQRWKLDICAQQDAVLQLSAVNLPGSAQVPSQRLSSVFWRCSSPLRTRMLLSLHQASHTLTLPRCSGGGQSRMS